jgi:branched-subunit amino acid ABC-type transport system permease component
LLRCLPSCNFTTFGMVVRAGMQDRETVGLLGINIQRRFTIVFGLAAAVAGVAGAMYTPILPPDYTWAWTSWSCPSSWSW